MTTTPQSPGEPGGPLPDPHPMLDYAKSDWTMRPAAQWCLGIAAGAIPTLATAFFAPFAAGMAGAVIGPLVVAVMLFTVGLHLRRGVAYRAMAAGIWTGIGLAALIDGLCLTALNGARFAG